MRFLRILLQCQRLQQRCPQAPQCCKGSLRGRNQHLSVHAGASSSAPQASLHSSAKQACTEDARLCLIILWSDPLCEARSTTLPLDLHN